MRLRSEDKHHGTSENLQIEKHKSGRRSFRSPDWFVLFELQIFFGGVYPPSATWDRRKVALFHAIESAIICDLYLLTYQGSKNRPPSGHLRLKMPFGEWNIPFSGQFGNWKLPFSGQVGDQTFFQGGQRRWGLNVIAQGEWRSLLVQDARCVWTPLIVFASKSTPGVYVPSLRFSFRDHLSLVGRRKYRTRCDCQCAWHIRHHGIWVFFSSGLSGESVPVHYQGLAFVESVRSKKKEKKNSKKKVLRRTEIRRQQQRHRKFQRTNKNSCRLGVTETIITLW